MANGLFSAIGAVYKALRARLTREGIHVGSTADYPRVEIHSITESEWMDKGHTLKSISCIVECISARRMQDVMEMSEENLARMLVFHHFDAQFGVCGMYRDIDGGYTHLYNTLNKHCGFAAACRRSDN